MRTGNRLSKGLNCCLLVENSANGFARSSFQMQLCYLGVHAPLRTSRWQTNKNLPSLRIFALGQIYLNESGTEWPNPRLK